MQILQRDASSGEDAVSGEECLVGRGPQVVAGVAVGMAGGGDGPDGDSSAEIDLCAVGDGFDAGAGPESVVGRVDPGGPAPVHAETLLVALGDPAHRRGPGQYAQPGQLLGECGGSSRVVGVAVGEQEGVRIGARAARPSPDAVRGPAGTSVDEDAAAAAAHEVDVAVQRVAEIEPGGSAGEEMNVFGQLHGRPCGGMPTPEELRARSCGGASSGVSARGGSRGGTSARESPPPRSSGGTSTEDGGPS